MCFPFNFAREPRAGTKRGDYTCARNDCKTINVRRRRPPQKKDAPEGVKVPKQS